MNSNQLDEISNLLLEYSAGNYEYQGKVSEEVNELDMIVSGINMLGEELRSTSVSRDYFGSIFNAVTDLVIIVNDEGIITDLNSAAENSLDFDSEGIYSTHIDTLISGVGIFKDMSSKLSTGKPSLLFERSLIGKKKKPIIGQITSSRILNRFDKFMGYLVSIKDITRQKQNEQLILKTIFVTQQSEQKRVADDIHDSLGQELSMTKLMITNLRKIINNDPRALELIQTCTDILDNSIGHLREICFNLMPSVLTRGGLNMALADLTRKLQVQGGIKVKFKKNDEIDRIDADLEIVIYRIAQEFINNMIKHAKASELVMKLDLDAAKNEISLYLKDNGCGFVMKKLDNIGENRGYQNLQTKVKAFNGNLVMKSAPGKGTSTQVKFPIEPYYEQD